MRRRNQRTQQAGFTLLEVLVALTIVAVVSVLSWQGLQEVLRMRDRLKAVDTQLQTTTAIFTQLEDDLARLERAVPKGQGAADTVRLDNQALLLLHTQRRDGLPVEQFQTVWIWQDGQIFRLTRPINQPDNEVRSEGLAAQGIQFRFWEEGVGWGQKLVLGNINPLNQRTPAYQGRDNPLSAQQPNAANTANTSPVVRAVEVLITQPNGQSVVRILNSGGRY